MKNIKISFLSLTMLITLYSSISHSSETSKLQAMIETATQLIGRDLAMVAGSMLVTSITEYATTKIYERHDKRPIATLGDGYCENLASQTYPLTWVIGASAIVAKAERTEEIRKLAQKILVFSTVLHCGITLLNIRNKLDPIGKLARNQLQQREILALQQIPEGLAVAALTAGEQQRKNTVLAVTLTELLGHTNQANPENLDPLNPKILEKYNETN
jgi:hypothetical protein